MSSTHELGIVVGVDGSPSSMARSRWATRDAAMRNVPLSVIHVVAPIVVGTPDAVPPDYSQLQEEAAQSIIEQAHCVAVAAAPSHEGEISTEILHAQPVPAMVEPSRRALMVAVGCRGQGAVEQALMGSVSAGIAHHAHCPVAIIHQHLPDGTPHLTPPSWSASTVLRPRRRPASRSTKHPGAGWTLLLCTPGATWAR